MKKVILSVAKEAFVDKGFDILENLITGTSMRQKVIASNIANADTPGYTARDVNFGSFLNDENLQLKTTDKMHFKGGPGSGLGSVITDENTLYWGDKNNVELDMEVSKMTENSLLNQTAATLISTKIKQYKIAFGGK
ncbi:MAG: flagellar basal body rod protein FlgB [Nitrospirae bacterium]|nr:flagellar basal body rod protein FlgB [Nitrospirota bacterium]